MQLGNLKEGDPTYRTEPVEAVYWQEKPVQGRMKHRPRRAGEPKLYGIDVHPLLTESQRAELDAQKAEQARWRTWTTADGKYKVHAAFRGAAAGTVRLEREDGSVIEVNIDRLSQEDQEYIKSFRRGR